MESARSHIRTKHPLSSPNEAFHQINEIFRHCPGRAVQLALYHPDPSPSRSRSRREEWKSPTFFFLFLLSTASRVGNSSAFVHGCIRVCRMSPLHASVNPGKHAALFMCARHSEPHQLQNTWKDRNGNLCTST